MVVKNRLKQKIIIQNEWSVPYNKVLDRTPLRIRKKWEILQNNNDNGSPVVNVYRVEEKLLPT